MHFMHNAHLYVRKSICIALHTIYAVLDTQAIYIYMDSNSNMQA